MNLKPLWAFMAVFFVVSTMSLIWILRDNTAGESDPVACNDIVCTVGEQWGGIGKQKLPGAQYHLDYAVLDLNGKVLAATRPGLDTTFSAAVRHRDMVLDVRSGGKVVGNILFSNPESLSLKTQRRNLRIAAILLTALPLLFCAGFALYLRRKWIHPFRKLDRFARRVAAGNLDVPLEMDRKNLFGPFTESFDLMRSELKRAKENEYRVSRSKKELVASLSHDIKTPLASIQAIAELLLVKEQDEPVRKRLEIIYAKAKQITQLVTNLFHASLEELEKLKVSPAEESSEIVAALIHAADYDGRAVIPAVPPCILCMDRLRLSQVFDNIFSNSYKYADTAIRVEFSFDDDFLAVTISDSGPGAPGDSVPLLCSKFYRGENSKGKNGSGLGLYLASYLMKQMDGGFSCKNRVENGTVRGFSVRVGIPLAGRKQCGKNEI